ncbi:MAG: ParB N-terminal domain-containing protein [Peptostreptococcaceae bacterium]|nr:ParB N-terminal domain-containing protein [Peptostreptococcaceae bacterium]
MKVIDIPIRMIDVHEHHETKCSIENVTNIRNSIAEKGLANPITVRTNDNGRYQLINGYHRLKACRTLGWETISAHVQEVKFNNFTEAYISDREQNIHENTRRKQYNDAELLVELNELQELYYMKNPEARIMADKVEQARQEAEERAKKASKNLENPELKQDKDFWQDELKKSNEIIERTKTPLQKLIETGVGETKAKQIVYLAELTEKVNPNIANWVIKSDKISDRKVYNLKKPLSRQENLDKLRSIDNREDFIRFIANLEGKREAGVQRISDVLEETYGIAKIGRKHYLVVSDLEHKVSKNNFNTRVYIKDVDVAKATIKVLVMAHLEVLAVCETDESYDYMMSIIK